MKWTPHRLTLAVATVIFLALLAARTVETLAGHMPEPALQASFNVILGVLVAALAGSHVVNGN